MEASTSIFTRMPFRQQLHKVQYGGKLTLVQVAMLFIDWGHAGKRDSATERARRGVTHTIAVVVRPRPHLAVHHKCRMQGQGVLQHVH